MSARGGRGASSISSSRVLLLLAGELVGELVLGLVSPLGWEGELGGSSSSLSGR